MVQATVALRIDVDTRRGLREGVPRLAALLEGCGLRASFFVTMGPDRSGRALRRAWRPSFLAKMWRTNPLRLYGLRTLLSGTLLPAAPVGAGAPDLLRALAAAGHEVGPHGFDHVGWQDRVHRMTAAAVRADLAAAAAAYRAVFGAAPEATAAPGWRTTPAALAVQDEFGFRYASDVRGRGVVRAAGPAGPLATLQVATTMPTLDELLGRTRDPARALEQAVRPGLNVLTLHAEVEGGPLVDVARDLLDRLLRRRVELVRVRDALEAARADAEARPPAVIARGHVPGRSGWIAVPRGAEPA